MVWTRQLDHKDKKEFSSHLKELYRREPQQFDTLLSKLINPKSKEKFDAEKCLTVICGGHKLDEFTKIIKSNDRSVICGLVWDANFIAYRCKTCGITPCMSLCAECFENGNHEGHDFNMFKSTAGGACDCGDVEVMKACGFCSRHGPKSAETKRNIAPDVTLMVELVVPKLIHFLVCKLEDATFEKHEKVGKLKDEVKDVTGLLLQLCEMGDLTRNIVAQNMLHRTQKKLISGSELTSKVTVKTDVDMPPYNIIRRQSSKDISRELGINEGTESSSLIQSVVETAGPSKTCDVTYLVPFDGNETILEKVIDLLIELKFPQLLVTLVLSMLQEVDYKREFMKAFCCRYSKIANLLTHRYEKDEDHKLCNRLVHASVQLFSNENLTYTMVENNNLLTIIVTALSDLISRTLIKLDKEHHDINRTLFVVNCDHDIINNNRFWPVVSDFHNLLSHSKIARYFLQEPALIRRWMGILVHLTGMNKNLRQLIVHVTHESLAYQCAYSTEVEISSHIMMNLLAVCGSVAEKDAVGLVLNECVRALRSWFRMTQVQIVKPFLSEIEGEAMTTTGPIPRQEISFQLPLHRYLAAFISQGVNCCGMTLEDVLPSEEILWCVLEHVLRIQVGIGEILAGMWVRNGYSIRSQEELYLQGQCSNMFVDLDIFLLQVCAMSLDSEQLIRLFIQRYKLESWFEFGKLRSQQKPMDSEAQQALVENMLNLILQLLYQRMYMGLSEERIVHLEVVTKLTMGNFTHSQLSEHLPEKPGVAELTDLFDRVLSKVSDYKQPSNESGRLTQGIYVLKPDLWKSDFQPLHVMLRGSYKRGYQQAMDNYKGWYQTHNKAKVKGLWPPFRKPLPLNPRYHSLLRLLKSKTLHAVLFTLLYKAVHEQDSVNDSMTYLTFYLIDMCLDAPDTIVHPNIEKGSLKTDVTVAELEDGTVPGAVVKCLDFLYEFRDVASGPTGPDSPTASSPPPSPHDDSVQELVRRLLCSPYTFTILPDQYTIPTVQNVLLHLCQNRLQPSLFSVFERGTWTARELAQLNVNTIDDDLTYHIQQVLEQLPPHRYTLIKRFMHYIHTLHEEDQISAAQLSKVYLCFDIDEPIFNVLHTHYDWIFRVRSNKSENTRNVFDIRYQHDDIAKNSYRCVLGTSIIQLIYQLRKKLQNTDHTISPMRPSASSSNFIFHNGIAEIDRILKKLCEKDQNNAKLLKSLERADATTPDESISPESASEAKRKRAKERQAKLLAQFATRQKAFESMMEGEEVGGKTVTDGPDHDEEQVTCIICGFDGVPSESNPFGIFTMCQPSSLLLHATLAGTVLLKLDRPVADHPIVRAEDSRSLHQLITCHVIFHSERIIMDEENEEIPTYHSTITTYYSTLNSVFTPLSAWQSHGLQAQPGVHVQSCRHYFHVSCHSTYRESQHHRGSDPLLNPLTGREMNCPICRRLSNSALPIIQNSDIMRYTESQTAVLDTTLTHSCNKPALQSLPPQSCPICQTSQLATQLSQKSGKQFDGESSPTKINTPSTSKTPYYEAVDRFTSSLQEYYSKYVHQKSISRLDVMLLTLHDTIRVELLDEDDNTRKYATGQLLRTLIACSNQVVESHSSNDILLSLAKVILNEHPPSNSVRVSGAGTSGSAIGHLSEVPLILQDPKWILLKFSLFSKCQTTWQSFKTTVRLLFILQITRELVTVTSRFSRDEQIAWITKPLASDAERIIGVLCKALSTSNVSLGSNEMDITSYVWTIQSVESRVQEGSLLFLQMAVLLAHHLYDKPLPNKHVRTCHFSELVSALDLAATSSSFVEALGMTTPSLARICEQLVSSLPLPTKFKALSQPILPISENWDRPRLLTLPRLYCKLYLHYRGVKCKVCRLVPNDPALCLVCGELVCVKSSCCTWLNKGECTKHAQMCGAGTAIYLVIMSSTVVIVRGDRIYLWGSVYLDQHDEEDLELRRGKPLYLSDTRYQCLNQQWRSHSFDHTLRKWGWHQQLF